MAVLGLVPRRSARPSAPSRPMPVECKGVDTRTECAHDEAAMPVRHGRPRACPEEIGPAIHPYCAITRREAWMTGPSPVMTTSRGHASRAELNVRGGSLSQ